MLNQDELKKHPGYLLARARWQAFRAFEAHIGRRFELRPVEYSILVLLASNHDVSQAQLAQALGVAAPNMTGILRRLEGRGLIAKERAPSDRRVQHIVLTPAGEALLGETRTVRRAMDRPWMGRLSRAEQATLMTLLDKLLAAPKEEG